MSGKTTAKENINHVFFRAKQWPKTKKDSVSDNEKIRTQWHRASLDFFFSLIAK